MDMTAGYVPAKKATHQKSLLGSDLKQPFNEKRTPSCEEVFKTLIEKLTSAPISRMPAEDCQTVNRGILLTKLNSSH